MNIALWIAQILLAFAFLGAAYVHAVRWEHTSVVPGMKWLADIGRRRAIGSGLLDAAGGVGVIAPAVTGILVWLTPLAAVGLTLLMVSAIIFHIVRHDSLRPLVLNLILGLLAAFVAYGRFVLAPL
jgi:hypothetical protein